MSVLHTIGCYRFESIEATSLALIPLLVRYRLDHCSIKLHLRQWQQFSQVEREQLLQMAFTSPADAATWEAHLTAVLQQRCLCAPDRLIDTVTPAWQQLDQWPVEIVDRCAQLGLALPALAIWQSLTTPHRHALYKIARSRHDHVHLAAALHEFSAVGVERRDD